MGLKAWLYGHWHVNHVHKHKVTGVCAEDAVGVEAVAVEEGFGDGGKIHTKDSFYRNFYRERVRWNM